MTLHQHLRFLPIALAALLAPSAVSLSAQTAAPATPATEENITLTPFTVEAAADKGYAATTTLAGTRLRTELKDIGTSISVLTAEFLNDIGATDALTALAYTTNFEVTGTRGNYLGAGDSASFGNPSEVGQFLNPSQSTRVRGLVSADNTRNYFRTTVGWDTYNVGRVDLLRGPNSILFGLGSPGGVVNGTTDSANLRRDSGRTEIATDQFGGVRGVLNFNKVILKDQLAVRAAFVADRKKFRQEQAFDDEDRQFIAGTYKPSFLNKNGHTFEVSIDYERGEGDSNRPRLAPPVDSLSPFFSPLEIRAIQLPAGTNFRGYANGLIPASQYFVNGYTVSEAGSHGAALPAGVGTSFDGNGIRYVAGGAQPGYWTTGRLYSLGVLQPNGQPFTTNSTTARRLYGTGYQEKVLAPLNTYALNTNHPFAQSFVPTSLTDPTVFDYYNNLIDGPNKAEWSKFKQARAVISHTFFRQKLGYELSAFRESADRGQTTLMSDNNRIFIDINQTTVEGTPNPNIGRAFVQETTFAGNRIQKSELEAARFSAFFDHNFSSKSDNSWWRRALGRHVLNGVLSRDVIETDVRNFQRHVYSDELLNTLGFRDLRFNNNTRTAVKYYLSGDLRGRGSLAGAGLAPLDRSVLPGDGPIPIRYFDTTWKATGVNPAAPWTNPLGQVWDQAANPANYVGWRERNFELIDALSGDPADLNLATRAATLNRNKVESKILAWQGYLFDNVVVGTFGWREDESASVRTEAGVRPDRGGNVDPSVYNLANGDRFSLTTRSKNHSIVTHVTRLPGLRRLPLDVSFSYNKGENFNPSAGRIDVQANTLPPPQGSTKEYGVLLSTKDNRYSLRVTKYETTVLNDSAPAITNGFRIQQLLAENGAVAALSATNGTLRANYDAQVTRPVWSIDAQQDVHAPAWYAFERSLSAAFPSFVSQWLRDGSYAPSNAQTFFNIGGTNTADTLSKGYELELTANPTDSLRLTLNASKTHAERDNVPGRATIALYEFIQGQLFEGTQQTAAGQLRSAFDPFGRTMADFWIQDIWPNYLQLQQFNGQRNPEAVEWRVNAVANHTFRNGRLKGFGVGGAYRWEGERAVGYPRYFDEFGLVRADVGNPFVAPATDRTDVWFSYRCKIFAKFDWRLQLNVYNVLGENELVPTRANPDGSFAMFRIQEGRSWRLSSTFSF